MDTTLITVGDVTSTEVALVDSAVALRDDLLAKAREVTAIADAFDAECAADVLRSITGATREVETARKAVKAPVLDLGKRIDDVAKQFSGDLSVEANRISRMLGSYEAEERRKQQEAERAARAEEEKRRREMEAATTDEDRHEAAREIVNIKSEVAAVAHRPEGTAVRESWQFEVTDINALYTAAPHLCTIVPDNTAIRAAIKKSQNIAGLRIWKEAKSYIR
jgi:hypothetical protein